MRTATIALGLSFLAACGHPHEGGGVPVFTELERNDDPLTANDFGLLRPGDHFIIDGFVRDDAADPFDGFAFTAAGPLHVDFQLFIHEPLADLDVCLYDPQLDQTLACFATSDDPERGGVDVLAGGFSFHLVVESFTGDSSYSLELDVQPLFARLPAEGEDAPRIRAVDAREEHASAAELGYRKPARAPRLVLEQELQLDENGVTLEIVHVRGQL